MRNLFTWIVALVPFITIAQSAERLGAIKGKVTTNDNKPAESVSIQLKGHKVTTTTNEAGLFSIGKLSAGSYELEISLVGFETLKRSVTIENGKTSNIDIQLQLSQAQLQEVVITSGGNKFSKKESDYIARMPLKNLENPQVYSVATKELLKEKDIVDYAAAMRSLPGASGASLNAYGFSSVYMRGFIVQSYVRNGLYAQTLSGGDPQVLERLEAIKGPSGTLFGSAGASASGQSNYGGIINKVTKRPFDGTLVEGSLAYGTYNLTRATMDVNTALNKDRTALLRVNLAYNSQGSFQDVGISQSFLIAPNLLYKINDKLSINVEAEINSSKTPSIFYFQGPGGATAKSMEQLKLNYFKSYSSNELTHPPTVQNFYSAQLNYQIAPNWRLNTVASVTDANSLAGVILGGLINDSLLNRTVYDWDYEWHTADIQANLNGTFKIGKMQNKLLVGLDYQRFSQQPVSGGLYYNYDTVNLNKAATPVINVNKARANYNYIFSQSISSNDYAAYFSDVLNITEKLNLMLSLRFDHYAFGGRKDLYADVYTTPSYSKDAFTPKFGATYQLINNKLSLFANYMQGFSYVAPNTQGQTFKPEFARQSEAGFKIDLTQKLSATVSYYHINVENKVRTDPNNALLSVQDGTQKSEGVDLDLAANPVSGLNITGGYSYNKSRFTRSNKNIEGNRPAGVPNNAANAWASYTIQGGKVKGLGLGVGFNYNGQIYFNDIHTLSIGSNNIVKGTVFYSLSKFRLSLTMDNVTNQQYYNYVGLAQMPRRVIAGVSIKL